MNETRTNENEIAVFYKWTAKPGKLEALKAMYEDVYRSMKNNEPESLKMDFYYSEEENAIIVHDLFKNSTAMGLHLQGTAANHFPQLLEIAVPGPFFFCGDVPEELKQATKQMQLGAEFFEYAVGFDRRSSNGDFA